MAFLLAAAVTLGFAVRFAVFTIYWANPAHHQQPVEGWMTPGYIAHSWHVPPDIVRTALGLPPAEGKPEPLDRLAQKAGLSLAEAIVKVEVAISTERARQK